MAGTRLMGTDLPRPVVPEETLAIARRLEEAGHEAWCVGGALRDALLGAPHADFDLATGARPEEVQRLFRRTVPVGLRFGTVGVLDRRGTLHEVTTFRRDVRTDGRHAEVEYGASLDEDLARRDFTVNALAWHPLRHEWRDPHGGMADLRAGRLRAVGDPDARFREDYLRILRMVRFAARLGFEVDEPTWAAARAAVHGLDQLSAERVRDEWCKGLRDARRLARFVALWHAVGAAAEWLPELARAGDPRLEALARHDAGPPRDAVLHTALLCDAPALVLARLRASGHDVARAEAIAAGPPAPAGPSQADVRRWLALVGGAAGDLLAAWRLRHGAEAPWAVTVAGIRARGEPLRRGDLAVTGRDLLEAGVPPGPAVGRCLDRLLELVLEDPSLNVRETLITRAGERR